MKYELYIDVLFLVNFGMDFGLLLAVKKILKSAGQAGRLFLASLFGAAAACAAAAFSLKTDFFPAVSAAWEFFLVPFFMARIAFGPRSFRETFKEMLVLEATAICLGGLIEALYEHTPAGYGLAMLLRGDLAEGMPVLVWIFAAAGSWFLFRYVWLTMTETRRETAHLRHVTLQAGTVRVRTLGFLDTGNRLTEPKTGRPVHIVSEKLWKKLLGPESRIFRIPYCTVGNPAGLMDVMKVDVLSVEGQTEEPEALIGRAPFPFSKNGRYEVLLHEKD